MTGAVGRTVTVTSRAVADLVAVSGLDRPDLVGLCPPLVAGLLAVLDDPAHGVVAATTRHAHVEVERLAPLPLDTDLRVDASLTGTARLGTGDGLWVAVEVAGPDGPVARTRHVVAATVDPRPVGRGTLPAVPRGHGAPTGSFTVDAAALDAYRAAAGDTSPAHGPAATAGDGDAIVPGLLALMATLARLDPPGSDDRVVGRFPHPLPVGAVADVTTGPDGTGAATSAGRTVVRLVRP